MGLSKRKTVFNGDEEVLQQVKELIASGRYKSLSEFVREAMAEKLKHLRQQHLNEAVVRYCAAGYAGEDSEMIRAQALDDQPERPAQPQKRRRAKG